MRHGLSILLLVVSSHLCFLSANGDETTLIREDKITKSDANDYLGVDLFSRPYSSACSFKQKPGGSWWMVTFATDPDWNRIVYADYNDNWIKAYGSYGSGNGHFKFPRGIAADKFGNVYVADFGNDRIVKLSYDFNNECLNFVQNITGGLRAPYDVDIDNNGTPSDPGDDAIWVVDHGNHRVVKFAADGTFLISYGSYGSWSRQFKFPQGVATWGPNCLYVVDTGNNRICQLIHYDNEVLVCYIYEAPSGSYLRSATTDYFGSLWVTDMQNSRLLKLNYIFEFVTFFGSHGTGLNQFIHPSDFSFAMGYGNSLLAEEWTNNSGGQYYTPGVDILDLTATANDEDLIVYCSFILTEFSSVTVDVYNQSDQLVRNLRDSYFYPGEKEIIWDCLDNSGQRVPWGTYTFRIRATTCYSPSYTNTASVSVEAGNHPPQITNGPWVGSSWDGNRYENHHYQAGVDAEDPDEDPLSYSWSVDGKWADERPGPAGTISGSGDRVTYCAPDYPSGKAVKLLNRIRVQITDTYNGSTSGSTGWFEIKPGSPPSGCPFLYTWDGSEYVEDNNILAASDIDSSEVTEYYQLEQPPGEEQNRCLLQLREFEQEHTYLDKIELLAIYHLNNVKTGVTTEGDIIAYEDELLPIACFDTFGQSYLELILDRDSTYFQGFEGDELVIDFGEIEVDSEDALHFVIVDKPPGPQPMPSIAVSVYKNGDWHYVERLLHRRNWWSQMIRPVEEGQDSLKIKLTWYEEQKLDYVSLAKAESEGFITKRCPLISAMHSNAGWVRRKLLFDDEDYADLVPGDTMTLKFAFFDIEWAQEDFVFMSNGYYATVGGGGTQMVAANNSIPIVHSFFLYPNPARTDMNIRFALPEKERVSLRIYDVSGRQVSMLVDARLEPGYHTVRLDDEALVSGIYFVRLITDGHKETKKFVLMR